MRRYYTGRGMNAARMARQGLRSASDEKMLIPGGDAYYLGVFGEGELVDIYGSMRETASYIVTRSDNDGIYCRRFPVGLKRCNWRHMGRFRKYIKSIAAVYADTAS